MLAAVLQCAPSCGANSKHSDPIARTRHEQLHGSVCHTDEAPRTAPSTGQTPRGLSTTGPGDSRHRGRRRASAQTVARTARTKIRGAAAASRSGEPGDPPARHRLGDAVRGVAGTVVEATGRRVGGGAIAFGVRVSFWGAFGRMGARFGRGPSTSGGKSSGPSPAARRGPRRRRAQPSCRSDRAALRRSRPRAGGLGGALT